MKAFFSFSSLCTLLLLSACINEPFACFNVSNKTPQVGETVKFSNCSLQSSIYNWDFGDGSTSTSKSPSHAYSVAGTYKVTLSANQKAGGSPAIIADQVVVSP